MEKKYKRALITGATSGIGEAFVDVLPASTDLILTGRNAEKLGALQERLAVGGRVEIIEADLRSPTDRKKLISRSESLKTDLFVNNAGLGFFVHFTEIPADDEAAMVDVNVVAVHELTHALLPSMIEQAKQTGERAGAHHCFQRYQLSADALFCDTPQRKRSISRLPKVWRKNFPESLSIFWRFAREPQQPTSRPDPARQFDMFDCAESSISVARKAMRALGRRRVLVSQLPMRVRPVLQHRNTSHRFQRRTRLFQTFVAAQPENEFGRHRLHSAQA